MITRKYVVPFFSIFAVAELDNNNHHRPPYWHRTFRGSAGMDTFDTYLNDLSGRPPFFGEETHERALWYLAVITYRRMRLSGLDHDFAETAAVSAVALTDPELPNDKARQIVISAIAWAMVNSTSVGRDGS